MSHFLRCKFKSKLQNKAHSHHQTRSNTKILKLILNTKSLQRHSDANLQLFKETSVIGSGRIGSLITINKINKTLNRSREVMCSGRHFEFARTVFSTLQGEDWSWLEWTGVDLTCKTRACKTPKSRRRGVRLALGKINTQQTSFRKSFISYLVLFVYSL